MSGFDSLPIATPLGEVVFPIVPGVKVRGSAIVDPDGAVRIHLLIAPSGPFEVRRHYVYAVRGRNSRGLLEIDLIRGDADRLYD